MFIILKFLYVEINVFAMIVLFLIFLTIHRRTGKYMLVQNLYHLLIASNALILLLDSLMWILDGTDWPVTGPLFPVVTALYYSMNPIICTVWTLYADYQIFGKVSRLKTLFRILLIPVGAVVILSFLSILSGTMFYFDADNVYHRGSLFLLMALVCYALLVYTMITAIARHKKMERKNFIPILIFAIPPFIAGIIQTLYFGLS